MKSKYPGYGMESIVVIATYNQGRDKNRQLLQEALLIKWSFLKKYYQDSMKIVAKNENFLHWPSV